MPDLYALRPFNKKRSAISEKKQPTLFELMGYSYQVIVTNIEWMSRLERLARVT